MYVVAGRLKGKKLTTLKGLRAVEARVKKVLFNLFREEIKDSYFLDLFAGTGSLGIEAFSWGAQRGVFVDINPQALRVVKKNLASLGLLGLAEVYCKDGILACKKFFQRKEKFDFIFLDPPYRKGLITKTLKTLRLYDIVAPSGFIVCLGWHKEEIEEGGFSCIFNRRYGDRLVKIYKK